jgi:UDP-glucose:(glucosyl)LPS beta-1,3-glucosyltransferase
MEVIVVNDGSTDKTEMLLQKYVSDNSPIVFISLKKNSGVSVARNTGLRSAKGKYVWFLDADDIIPDKTLNFYRNFLSVKKADIFVFGYAEKKDEFLPVSKVVDNAAYDGKEFNAPDFLEHFFSFNIRTLICCLIFRKDFLERQRIEFPVGVKYGEDVVFYEKTFISADNIYCSKKIVFVRIFRQDSTTQGGKIFVGDRIQDFLEKVKCTEYAFKTYPQIAKSANYALASWYFGMLKAYLTSSKKDNNVTNILLDYKYLLSRSMLFVFPKSLVLYLLRFIPVKFLLISKMEIQINYNKNTKR